MGRRYQYVLAVTIIILILIIEARNTHISSFVQETPLLAVCCYGNIWKIRDNVMHSSCNSWARRTVLPPNWHLRTKRNWHPTQKRWMLLSISEITKTRTFLHYSILVHTTTAL
jgi:hypothetical protein